MGTIIAQRYRVVASIGKGSFSRVVQCLDLHEKMMVSVKVLRNDKDCMDQGLGEVRLLALIGQHDARGEQPLLSMLDYFYYKEHLLIVTELLRDSVFNFYRYLSNFLRPTFSSKRSSSPYTRPEFYFCRPSPTASEARSVAPRQFHCNNKEQAREATSKSGLSRKA